VLGEVARYESGRLASVAHRVVARSMSQHGESATATALAAVD
jgi:hypothetical protein